MKELKEPEEYAERVAEKTHYVNNKELLNAMKEYRPRYLQAIANGESRPDMPDAVASAIMQIATKMSRMHNFVGYSYRSEMISVAILQLTAKFHLFDPLKSDNFFAYASQICWNSFIGVIKDEQKQTSIRARMINDKVTTDFVQNLENDAETSNAFVEFLKENEIFVDYYEQRKTQQTHTGLSHPSLRHKNLTPYEKKQRANNSPETNLYDLADE